MNESHFMAKRMQLFCIPFAGGSKSAFQELAAYIDSKIEVIMLEYPGHDSRVREPFCENMDQVVADISEQIMRQRDDSVPFSLLGYSMGSIVTYELLHKADCQKGILDSKPVHLFLCANEALSHYHPHIDIRGMTREKMIEILVKMGGIDERIQNNQRFLNIFLRPIIADYHIICDYKFENDGFKPQVDCSVFYAAQDISYEQVQDWNTLISGNVDFHEFGRNHFFIRDCAAEMAETINRILNEKIRS